MKHIYTLIVILFICQLYGQTPVWNKELPFPMFSTSIQISVQPQGDEYLIGSQGNIITLNQLGEITGAVLKTGPMNVFGSFIRQKTDPQTGEKYFLTARTILGNPSKLIISEYRPGLGFVKETFLDDQTPSASFSPVFIDLNDSIYVVLGRKQLRQITHRPGLNVVVNWEKPNTLGNPNAGLKTPDGVVGVSQDGVIFKLDAVGTTIWADTLPYVLRDIQVADGGFMAVGRTIDSLAVLIKLSVFGAVEWSQVYTNDFLYNNLLSNLTAASR